MNKLFMGKFKYNFTIMVVFAFVSLLFTGCVQKNNQVSDIPSNNSNLEVKAGLDENADASSNVPKKRKTAREGMVDLNVELEENFGKMVTYDVSYMGRNNPFMPQREEVEYRSARNSAIKEANFHNAEIIRIKNLENVKVREQDDISPYSFNLPVPPTSSGAGSVASTITKTKVVGIMYNDKSPSAIINVNNKDYLVRPGDKIIGQEYIVTKINPTWVTAAMGPNVYSAAIGELFSKDSVDQNQTDIYDLKNRFGGRKI